MLPNAPFRGLSKNPHNHRCAAIASRSWHPRSSSGTVSRLTIAPDPVPLPASTKFRALLSRSGSVGTGRQEQRGGQYRRCVKGQARLRSFTALTP